MAKVWLISCLLVGFIVAQASSICLRDFYHESKQVINKGYRLPTQKTKSEIACLQKVCKSTLCAASYNAKTEECIGADSRLIDIAVKLGVKFFSEASKDWRTIINRKVSFTNNGPDGYWLMDNHRRGLNLGKVPGLDMCTVGLTFTGVGALGTKSPLRYATFTPTNRAQVILMEKNQPKVPIAQQFTFAAWMKPSDVGPYMAIIDSYFGAPTASRKKDNAPHFWVNKGQLILHLEGGKHQYTSVAAYKKPNEWHHVAVTYTKNNAQFYANGVPLKMASRYVKNPTGILQPRFIQIGRRQYGKHFRGNIACMAVYRRRLCPKAIMNLKQSCFKF